MADFHFLRLRTKPEAQICYSFQAASSSSASASASAAKPLPLLAVFLNGLGLPQAGWMPAIAALKELRADNDMPALLTYDRFGQAQTVDRDPQDAHAEDPSHGHDCLSAIKDLRQIVLQVGEEHFAGAVDDDVDNKVMLVLVCNSIGCALARLYSQEYPGTVAGILFLDSVLANSDFVSVFPDPKAAHFDPSGLPGGITAQDLTKARDQTRRVFHPDNGSREGLSRKNLRDLLPASDGPVLRGPGGHGPFITVLGHDYEAFAKESAMMGTEEELTRTYTNPYWDKYNQGLARLTEPGRSKGPLHVPNAGHFVQEDSPAVVAEELNELLSKIGR